MECEPLNNTSVVLTISVMAEGFPGPHDPVACVEMTSSLVSHVQSSKGLTNQWRHGLRQGNVETCDVIIDQNNVMLLPEFIGEVSGEAF